MTSKGNGTIMDASNVNHKVRLNGNSNLSKAYAAKALVNTWPNVTQIATIMELR